MGASNGDCVMCYSGTWLLKDENSDVSKGYCITPCPDGYYGHSSGYCANCDITCKTCYNLGENMCTSCNAGRYLLQGYCLEVCPDGYYHDDVNHKCVACHSSCMTCSSGAYDKCNSCYAWGFLLTNEDDDSIRTCVDPCPVGYFGHEMSRTCILCDLPNCVNCTADATCTECVTPYVLWMGTCVMTCPEG
jgi:proprotein convertase subtilisin/kexin type 5